MQFPFLNIHVSKFHLFNIKNLLFITVFVYLQIVLSSNIITAQTVIGDIDVGNSPRGIAVNPSTNLLYITNTDDNSVSVIDGETNEIVNNIETGECNS